MLTFIFVYSMIGLAFHIITTMMLDQIGFLTEEEKKASENVIVQFTTAVIFIILWPMVLIKIIGMRK